MKNKIYQIIAAGIYGDVLGVPYEFLPRNQITTVEFTGGGAHGQDKGSWSDDTSMTLATMDWISDNFSRPLHSYFLHWHYEINYLNTPKLFDIGIQTKQALMKLGNGEERGKDSYSNNGNGSLMRIAPVAFIGTDTVENLIKEASSVTHNHKISIEACLIFSKILQKSLTNDNLTEVLLEVAKEMKYSKEFENLLDDPEDFLENPQEFISSTGYVVHSLEAAVWSSHQSRNTIDNIKTAIKLGNDTDTIGLLTGQLSAALYGFDLNETREINNFDDLAKPIIDRYLETLEC